MATNPKNNFDAYITVRVAEATHGDLTKLAEADKRTVSNYVRMVLERHVERAKAAAGEAESKAA